MTTKLDKFFAELAHLEFPEMVQKINTYMYDVLEAQQNKSGGGKVTKEIMQTVKKCMDQINNRLVSAHRDYVASETRLKTMVTDSKAYDALIQRRLRTSDGSFVDKGSERAAPLKRKQARVEAGFSVLITPSEGSVEEIRTELKGFSKDDQDFPKLSDVVSTRAGQLVLKVKTREDSEKLVKKIESLATRAKISAPRRRRYRVLLLSLDNDLEDDKVTGVLGEVLKDEGVQVRDMDVVRKTPTRQGKTNWVIDVGYDAYVKLLDLRRICIDFKRYRIVEYLQIIRCFKCQNYGHISSRCPSDTQKCPKCAGSHALADCTAVLIEACANCINNEDVNIDSAHRADSPDCPAFKAYRASLLAKRL